MCSLALNPAVTDQHDAVGGGEQRRAAGQHDRGAVLRRSEPADAVRDGVFGDGVDRRRRVVQDQHVGVGSERPGQGPALPLAAGQAGAALDHGMVQAVGVSSTTSSAHEASRAR